MFLKVRALLPIDRLTGRELEVPQHVAAGRTYKGIARLLQISPATARNHIQWIHGRLQGRTYMPHVEELGKFFEVVRDWLLQHGLCGTSAGTDIAVTRAV